jgi:hypothetical protein
MFLTCLYLLEFSYRALILIIKFQKSMIPRFFVSFALIIHQNITILTTVAINTSTPFVNYFTIWNRWNFTLSTNCIYWPSFIATATNIDAFVTLVAVLINTVIWSLGIIYLIISCICCGINTVLTIHFSETLIVKKIELIKARIASGFSCPYLCYLTIWNSWYSAISQNRINKVAYFTLITNWRGITAYFTILIRTSVWYWLCFNIIYVGILILNLFICIGVRRSWVLKPFIDRIFSFAYNFFI